MKEKINIAELLKDCPKGMELDCAMYENVTLFCASDSGAYPIKIETPDGLVALDKYGCYSSNEHAKCVIFPKGKTTWEGFVPPCKFKDGDVLFVDCSDEEDKSYQYIFILNKPEFYGKWHSYCYLNRIGDFNSQETYLTDDEYHPRFATEEEKQKLFQAIKDNDYKWNAETKTLDKLHKFKAGDEIRGKYTGNIYTISHITLTGYELTDGTSFDIDDECCFELTLNKFDINTLVPFESRVLVRDTNGEKWKSNFWGFYDSDHAINHPHECCGNTYRQCIPYEGNEHLLGKTDDCDDFYKTWE